ncbi:hypothetical protein TNCV_3615301 [Trichonephila clavipes]|nr:hypothetical protein TNCV_3615301 [Trichonephila clavipes]
MASGIEPRASSLESDALTTGLPTDLQPKDVALANRWQWYLMGYGHELVDGASRVGDLVPPKIRRVKRDDAR